MAPQHLFNYLKAFRKRSALSQEDVAYLLGTQSGAKVCRYERFAQEPGLRTALAFEVMFQKSISELFPGLFEEIQKDVRARAKKLKEKSSKSRINPVVTRKLQTLAAIALEKPTHQLEEK